MSIDWAQPLSAEPLTASPQAVFLRALAAELEAGAPTFYAVTFRSDSQVHAQLAAGRNEEPAAILAWARILGVTTIKKEPRHGTSGNARYSVTSLFAGYRLEVWDAWSTEPEPLEEPATYVPIAELDRGFGDPPPAPAGHPPTWPGYIDDRIADHAEGPEQ